MIKIETTKNFQRKIDYFDRLGNLFHKSDIPRIMRNEVIKVLVDLAKKEKKGKKGELGVKGRRTGINKSPEIDDLKLTINSGRRNPSKKNLAWIMITTATGRVFVPAGRWDENKNISSFGKIEDATIARLLTSSRADAEKYRKIYQAARGSTAKNWLELATQIWETSDRDPDRASPIRNAKKINGGPYKTSALKRTTRTSYSIYGSITSGILDKSGGQRRVDNAFIRRQLFFQRAIKRGFLNDAKFQASNIGGVFVRKSALF